MKTHGTASKLESGQLAELGAAILRQLPHIEGLDEVAQGWIENGAALKDALRKALTPAALLLDLLSTIKEVAATGKFAAGAHFFTGNREVKIPWTGDNFKQWFLAKVEEPQAEAMLRCHKLKKASLDAPILAELGSVAETTLASIWELLKKQPSGQSGTLLTNGYANIFYVRDANGVLRAVDVGWFSGGWRVGARSVGSPREWSVGNQVFSRNS